MTGPRPAAGVAGSGPAPTPRVPARPDTPREPARPDTTLGDRVLALATTAYGAALGRRAVAVYALGSLAHGGFAPAVSDVDLGLVLDRWQPGDDRLVTDVQRTVRASGPAPAERLSVCWSSLGALRDGYADGRFPAADRVDLLDHGRLLAGRDVRPLPRPSAAELTVSRARFALTRLGDERTVAEVHRPALLAADPVRLTKLVLMPVRLAHAQATGGLGLTDVAVRHHLDDRRAPARDLVRQAMLVRQGRVRDTTATVDLAHGGLSTLHRYLVDGHLPALDALGPPGASLATAFRRWRVALSPPR